MLIIGERINSSRERIAQAIKDRDTSLIQNEALAQVRCGADYIDVNAGMLLGEEGECLRWLVQVIQQVMDKPLCLDTANPDAAALVLQIHRGKAILNSITAERIRYGAMLPLIKKHGCKVIGLCMDASGIPSNAEGRVKIAGKIVEGLTSEGIPLDDIFIDPLVYPLSSDFESAIVVLDTIEQIRRSYTGVHIVCGLSNISFGLPLRKQLNEVFVVLAMQRGLDAAIVDPCDKQLMANIITTTVLMGKDEFCRNYIEAYRQGKLGDLG